LSQSREEHRALGVVSSRTIATNGRGFMKRLGALLFMNVIPIGDNLVVKRVEAEETTVGGIVLPDAAREKPRQGRVLSVGDGPLLPSGQRAGSDVQEGDRVVFGSYAGQEVDIDGEKLLILRCRDVLAILR
jgi:chaperonin GroES